MMPGPPSLNLLPEIAANVHAVLGAAVVTDVDGDPDSYATVDVRTGRTIASKLIGVGPAFDTLQLVGVTTRDHAYYQGTLIGSLRITG